MKVLVYACLLQPDADLFVTNKRLPTLFGRLGTKAVNPDKLLGSENGRYPSLNTSAQHMHLIGADVAAGWAGAFWELGPLSDRFVAAFEVGFDLRYGTCGGELMLHFAAGPDELSKAQESGNRQNIGAYIIQLYPNMDESYPEGTRAVLSFQSGTLYQGALTPLSYGKGASWLGARHLCNVWRSYWYEMRLEYDQGELRFLIDGLPVIDISVYNAPPPLASLLTSPLNYIGVSTRHTYAGSDTFLRDVAVFENIAAREFQPVAD